MKGIIRPETLSITQAVRVAVSNNFNCTKAEWDLLDQFQGKYPDKLFFVNCNIKTPKLLTLSDHPYQAVITANPDLTVSPALVDRLRAIDPAKIAFVRVKWLPDDVNVQALITRLLAGGHTVVVTMQRFNSRASLLRYTSLQHYHWSSNRYRLYGDSLRALHEYVDTRAARGWRLYICDRRGLGCGGCGLCSTLTVGKVMALRSLNLSASGICPYHCPDCYAKALQEWLVRMDQPAIRYDLIKSNKKQSGNTGHIKAVKAALEV